MVNEELLIEDPSAHKTFLRVDHYSFAKLLNKVEVGVFLKCAEILTTRLFDNVED
jgi:hypothetical protein